MRTSKLLGITLEAPAKSDALEKIKKYIKRNSKLEARSSKFLHVVSLNPENLVAAQTNAKFKKVLETAQIKIIDGVGVSGAAWLNGITISERVTGVDLMEALMNYAGKEGLKGLLIGGKNNIADKLIVCYLQKYPKSVFFSLEGIKDIKNPKTSENRRIFRIVHDMRPHLVLVAFGSPWQELWLDAHKKRFPDTVCMGVGGGFDYLGGSARRAPLLIRKIGFEWLFRLVSQPWRIKRQLKLITFVTLALKQRFGFYNEKS